MTIQVPQIPLPPPGASPKEVEEYLTQLVRTLQDYFNREGNSQRHVDLTNFEKVPQTRNDANIGQAYFDSGGADPESLKVRLTS